MRVEDDEFVSWLPHNALCSYTVSMSIWFGGDRQIAASRGKRLVGSSFEYIYLLEQWLSQTLAWYICQGARAWHMDMARAVTHLLQILPQHTKQKLLYCMWDKPYTRQRRDCSDFRIFFVLGLSLTLLNESADTTSVPPSSTCFSMATVLEQRVDSCLEMSWQAD